MPPFFSILVPTYNVVEFLGPALDSLLAQTDADWEAIVVNDGSTDGTPAVMDAYCARDSRFRAFHKENGGTASALNEGLKHARGTWVCWLSSDDLFEPGKLALHREWIRRHPDARFFTTQYRTLNNETGEITDEPMWAPVPDAGWQVIEMLRCTYVHGNAICAQREAWTEAGEFDPACGYGQDYDMWLRLMAHHPVTFIPEHTCITRESPSLGTRGFLEARLYGCARSAVTFLNRNPFESLFPLTDLSDPAAARAALDRAVDVAAGPNTFLYALGPHTALIQRILEWLWGDRPPAGADELRAHFIRRAGASARSHAGTYLGFLWKTAETAARAHAPSFHYAWVSVPAVAERRAWARHGAGKAADAEPLERYLRQFEGEDLPRPRPADAGTAARPAVFELPDADRSGAGLMRARDVFMRAYAAARSGRPVLLTGPSDRSFDLLRGFPFLGAATRADRARVRRAFGGRDAAIPTGAVGIAGDRILRRLRWRAAEARDVFARGSGAGGRGWAEEYEAWRFHGRWRRRCFGYDAEIGWRFLPNLRARLYHEGDFYTVRTNGSGLRSDREYPGRAPAGRQRVLVFGDSQTAGDGVSNGRRFTDLLEEAYADLDLINFGLPGTGTDQQLLLFETCGAAYEADAVMVCVTVEDILRLPLRCWPALEWSTGAVVYRAKPYFRMRKDRLLLHHVPVPRGVREEGALREWMEPHPPYRADTDDAPYDVYDSADSAPWQLMAAILARFRQGAGDRPLFVVPLPTREFIRGELAPVYLERFRGLDGDGVHVVDVLPGFAARSPAEREACTFPRDPHYTELGHRVVADALETALRERVPALLQGGGAG